MKRNIICRFLSFVCTMALLGTSALAAQNPKGYLYDQETGELNPYYSTPEEVMPQEKNTAEDLELTINPVAPIGFNRYCISYSPNTYTYDYNNERFKIGSCRVDNTKNQISDADLIFEVNQSSSVGIVLTLGASYGGETDAVFAKVSAKYKAEVATSVSWTQGTKVQTGATVPAGQIGRVTGYIVGVYTAGTATYRVLNTSTDESWTEPGAIGVLVPTSNDWNLVIEIPCK